MKTKIVLTQIMKNEAHVAERMLNSIKDFIDALCLVDTGSTDNTIEIVTKWAIDNNIEHHIFQRPFDNFENSRNYSIDKAKEIFLNRNDNMIYYGFWIDFDEILQVDQTFKKDKLDKDIYMVNTILNSNKMKYTRNELYKLDKPIFFYGPVHEYLICKDKNIEVSSQILNGIEVHVNMDGGSWKEDLSNKYIKHAHLLEQYISVDRSDPRWIFYTAQSYHDSASIKNNREENEERLRRSLKYYKERITRKDGYFEEIFYSQYRIAYIMDLLDEQWSLTMQEYLKAYNFDVLRAEPIKSIIDHYISLNEWNLVYLYTKFGVDNFHNRNPYPKRLLYLDQSLYEWKFLEAHSAACFYTNRKEEAKHYFKQLVDISKNKKELFTDADLLKIERNKNYFI
jgi:hypothetical protein